MPKRQNRASRNAAQRREKISRRILGRPDADYSSLTNEDYSRARTLLKREDLFSDLFVSLNSTEKREARLRISHAYFNLAGRKKSGRPSFALFVKEKLAGGNIYDAEVKKAVEWYMIEIGATDEGRKALKDLMELAAERTEKIGGDDGNGPEGDDSAIHEVSKYEVGSLLLANWLNGTDQKTEGEGVEFPLGLPDDEVKRDSEGNDVPEDSAPKAVSVGYQFVTESEFETDWEEEPLREQYRRAYGCYPEEEVWDEEEEKGGAVVEGEERSEDGAEDEVMEEVIGEVMEEVVEEVMEEVMEEEDEEEALGYDGDISGGE